MNCSPHRPLLLIPGVGGSCDQLLAAAAEMFPGAPLVPFDHQLVGPPASIEDLADLAAARIPTGECVYMCGESFGGPIALTLARRHPDRVKGLVLLSTFARHPSPGRPHTRGLLTAWTALVDRLPLLARGARIVATPGQFGRMVPLRTMAAYWRGPLLSGAEYRRRLGLIAAFDARPWLRDVEIPSLLLLGRHDPVVPAGIARELGRLLPNGTVHELNCGHLGYLAQPAEIRFHFEHWRDRLEKTDGKSA